MPPCLVSQLSLWSEIDRNSSSSIGAPSSMIIATLTPSEGTVRFNQDFLTFEGSGKVGIFIETGAASFPRGDAKLTSV